jgi:dynein heavy chain, axonemal
LFVVQREQAENIRQECESNMLRATPELYAAVASLQNLSKYDLNELRSLRNPPQVVRLLMDCVVMLLGFDPVKSKAKDGVTVERDYWTVAVGKQVLGNSRIIEILS